MATAELENQKDEKELVKKKRSTSGIKAEIEKREMNPLEQRRKEAQDAIDQVRKRRAEIEEKIVKAQKKKQIEDVARKKAALEFIEKQKREQEEARQRQLQKIMKEEREREQRR